MQQIVTINSGTGRIDSSAAVRDEPAYRRLIGPDDLDRIVKLCESGMPESAPRLRSMRLNEAYYRMENDQYVPKRRDESSADYAARPKQCLYLLRDAVDDLCDGLYTPGPGRKASRGDESAPVDEGAASHVESTILDVYKRAHVDVVMSEANRKAVINDACAIQVAPTEDPNKPLRFYTYGGDEFEVFCPPDDPTTPWAVVTFSVETPEKGKKRRVLTLYTDRKVMTFKTKAVAEDAGADDGQAFRVKTEDHGMGELPFVFIHNRRPVDTFWGNGLGTPLRVANTEIDRVLSDWAECQQRFLVPDMFTRNVADGWSYTKKPGRPQALTPPPETRMGDFPAVPEIFYLQPTLDWGAVKEHVGWYVDAIRSNLKIPPPMVSRDGARASSGIQVLAEQIPYWRYLESRRVYVDEVESELARKVTAVAGAYFGDPTLTAFAAEWPGMDLTWPPPAMPLPTPERNDSDAWEIERFVSSPQMIMARRFGISDEEAKSRTDRVAEDVAEWNAKFGQFAPTAMPTATGSTPDPNAPPPEPDPNAQPNQPDPNVVPA